MKNTIIAAAFVVALASAAQAADYDNTSVSMAAESATIGYSLSTNDTSRSINVYSIGRVLDLGAGVADNGTNRDYSVSVGRTITIPVGRISGYVDGEIEYNWGDTYTSNEIHWTPTLGASIDLGLIKPYAEVGYQLKSTEGDLLNINKDAPTMVFGTSLALTESASLSAKLTRSLNQDWKKTDSEVGLGITIKF
jgi:opacity protein-like surface antigen|tara:strand:+ start:4072 stop:4653 length:582 start_codon:yes stop_codon:yes gene_type:complete